MINIGDEITLYLRTARSKVVNLDAERVVYIVVALQGSGVYYRRREGDYTASISILFVRLHRSVADQRRDKINALV